MEFEWDDSKAANNLNKHGVAFEEATTVFGDPLALTAEDHDHSDDELRYITLGYSINNRLIVVVHTDRDEVLRIISSRPATSAEKRYYAEL